MECSQFRICAHLDLTVFERFRRGGDCHLLGGRDYGSSDPELPELRQSKAR